MNIGGGGVPIERHDDVWITTRDGTRLAARIWRPADPTLTVPAIVDCHPYRLSDSSVVHDAVTYPWFASHGYACVRVDLRGSGNSDGLLLDEYLPQEQLDACDVIEWIADQPWCSGSVGHIGISWGGFAGLQVAVRRPAALKAIITICASDDRYADDVHYRGGAVLANDMLPWASMMFMLNGLPPDPAVVGPQWRTSWHQRLQDTPPFIEAWLRHGTRDEYWRQGSACERYDDIQVPTFAVGGWNDGYVDAVLRLVSGVSAPVRGLIGPWSHGSPEQGVPGPAIGFLHEALRWWDQWLKGIDRGVLDEPPLRAWLQEPIAPAGYVAERPGQWVGLDPTADVTPAVWFAIDGGHLSNESPGDGTPSSARTPQSLGLDAGAWCPGGLPGDWPGDQRRDDGASLSFTSTRLTDTIDVIGNPTVHLAVSSDQPRAHLIVRLCDVGPDGSSLLVSRGVLDLTHRHGHDRVVPLVPGDRTPVVVPLKAVAHRFRPGHRIRIAVHTTYWPWVWPTVDEADVMVHTDADSWLSLPVLTSPSPSSNTIRFEPPEQAAAPPTEQLRPASLARTIERDVLTGEHELELVRVAPTTRLLDTGTELGFEDRTLFRIADGAPQTASVRCENRAFRRRGDWNVSVHTVSEMTADRDHYNVDLSLTAFEGDQQVHVRTWQIRVPR